MPLAEQRGGAELALLHLMQQGQELGVEWLVVFLQAGPMVRQVQDMGAAAVVVEAGRLREPHRFAQAVLRIAHIARREQVQMVFGWMGIAQLYGGLAARLAGIPAVWFQHGIPLDKNWIDRLATRLPAAGILTCSQAVADAQAQIAPARPLWVVHPGVELERFDPDCLPSPTEARRRLGLPAAGPLIGIVGRLQRWKGMHVLIESLPEVLQTHPDAHCVVVGGEHAPEPEYPAFLRERISALGLTDKVTLAGLQSNVPEWMQAMDVIVHASDHEPFGIVVIEAMALGKPVIAGNAAGPTEVITDGADGLLTPYGDAPALASAILRYLDDPEFARRTGQAARLRALDFSTRRYAENCVAALQGLLRDKK
jgi:glycosyltransferase involved in cell wall biosynthesis